MRKLGIGIAFTLAWAHSAAAQTPAGATGGGGGASPGGGATGGAAGAAGGGSGTSAGGVSNGPSVVVIPSQPAAPSAPKGPIGGGNVQYSSSKPITGPNDRDGFDFGPKSGGGAAMRAGDNGAIFSGGSRLGGSSGTGTHTVRRGDTLWEICDYYFQNPYQWPRIWSYNPQIQNPHWIYPGDIVKLRDGAQPSQARGGLTDRRRQVPANTIFLRNEGFIEDENDAVWGELNGSREDKMFLSDFDEVYMRILTERDIKIGQELTIFRPVKNVSAGKVVEIQGTVRVDQWNPKEKIARGRIIETLDTIERGARVGPIQRRFDVSPPVRNEKDATAQVITSLTPHTLYGGNQVVFINIGSKAGVAAGNRLQVIRKGDEYHKSIPAGRATRIAIESDSVAKVEPVPKPNEGVLPEEVFGELRVVSVRENTSVCVVIDARREIESGDTALLRKGF